MRKQSGAGSVDISTDTNLTALKPLVMNGDTVELDYDGAVFELSGTTLTLKNSGVDHGQLNGLADDDHPQYLKADGSRPLTGNWDAGNGRAIATDKIMARDTDGLYLVDDGDKF